MRQAVILILIAAVALISVFVGLLLGSFPISALQVLETLVFPLPGVVHDVIWHLRLPRVLAAFACGGLLALAGSLLQILLRNPLADPYILGVSGGAALAALTALLLGAGVVTTNISALAGAMIATAMVFGLSYRRSDWDLHRLLLIGIVLSAGFGALIGLLLIIAPQAQLKGMLFWLMGDLSHVQSSALGWLTLLVVLTVSWTLANSLNVLGLGALKAKTLGVAVNPVQVIVYLTAAAATAVAVMLGGTIGFVGLMVPHALRLLGIYDHRWLLPSAALAGGALVVCADTLARVAWAPQQLPVGVFTALLGVPALLFLLSKRL